MVVAGVPGVPLRSTPGYFRSPRWGGQDDRRSAMRSRFSHQSRFTFPLTLALLASALVLVPRPQPAAAYVEAPMPLGAVIAQSTNVCTMVVTSVDKQKN